MSMKQFSLKGAVQGAFTGRRHSSSAIMHVDGNHPREGKDITMTVPTFSSITEEEEVDISNYTQDDLERLRLEDPFLYYSIPAMKRKLYESDKSPIPMNSQARSEASSRRSSCPTIQLSSDGPEQQQRRESVKRARRVSVEPHPSVVMKRIMDEMNMNDEFDDSDMDKRTRSS